MRGLSSQMEGRGGTFWKISATHLAWMQAHGLDQMSSLLNEARPTEFQSRFLEAVLLYSRAALESDVAQKLLYVVVALETLLLRNDNEPIQSAVAERLAFAIGRTAADRKEFARLVKASYGLRSRFVHHGHKVDDLKTVEDFLILAFHFFTTAVMAHRRFKTADEFIATIEDLKWA